MQVTVDSVLGALPEWPFPFILFILNIALVSLRLLYYHTLSDIVQEKYIRLIFESKQK